MKKRISFFLAALLILTILSPLAAAIEPAPAKVWNAAKQAFFLKDGPEITRLAADSNEDGTGVVAELCHTADFRTLGDLYHAVDRNDDRLFADAIGLPADDVDGDLEVGVQLAYSFDGKTWVNDFDTDRQEEEPVYFLHSEFDLDGDGFTEYDELPNGNADLDRFFGEMPVFDGRSGCFTPYYCGPAEDMSIQQALTIRNNTLLQGKGEFTGAAYKADGDNDSKGFSVDFNRHTLYVKARYRVYTDLDYRNSAGEWVDKNRTAIWSGWGPVKTYNNDTASAEGQDCVPDMGALLTNAAPTLTALSTLRRDVERGGVAMKATNVRLAVEYPASTLKELAKFYALDADTREELTGEYFEPHLVYEMKVGSGDWFHLYSESASKHTWNFDDDVYWNRDQMEAQGYRPEDPVYLRVRLYGSDSYDKQRDEKIEYDRVVDKDEVFIRSGISNVLELNLTGKFNIRYETNGGSFPYGTTQVEMFDEATEMTVDLTTKDYTPEREHFTFNGWFTTKDFAKGTQIKSFNTAEKASRTYYAKWTELPFHTVSYDFGAVTDSVYNPNRDRIYTDDGTVKINDAEYSGARFLGWYDAAQGGSKVTSLVYASMKGDVTLYARWELPVKTITYAGAGKDYTNNAKNPASYQINPGGANETLIYAPEKTGYLFDGWYLNKDLDNGKLPYSEEKGAYLLNESEDVTLYAKWILGRWDIVYVLGLEDAWNGGNPDNYTYGNGILLQSPTRTGYTFDGWFADMAFKEKVTEIKGTDTGVKTLYAKWTAIPYKLNYDLRDPNADKFFNNPNPATRCIDDEIVLQPLAPAVKLYKFLGWYDNVNYDGDPVTKIAAGTDKDATLYAKLFKYSWGDVDFDGRVTAADARLILRYSVKLEEFTPEMQAWADVDAPSAERKITAADARLVLRMSVKLETAEGLKLPETPPGF